MRYMPILEFKEITVGRESDVFKRYKIKKESELYREGLSFTISTGKRTLDLEASSDVELNQFIKMLKLVQDFVVEEERSNQGKTAIEQSQMLMAATTTQQNEEGGSQSQFPPMTASHFGEEGRPSPTTSQQQQ